MDYISDFKCFSLKCTLQGKKNATCHLSCVSELNGTE